MALPHQGETVVSDLPIELSCPACGREMHVPFGEISGDSVPCPECGARVPVTEEQIDAAVERRMRAERKALRPEFRKQ